MEQIILFLDQNPWFFLLLAWTLLWKGLSLWKAAKANSLCWFIVLLLINTLGILEILYFFVFSRRKKINPVKRNLQ